ncbi:HNH endonuclease family protein [Streptomyces sp. NPDC088258]|uniref:HNH endonuclease family protein n=1 Tax=Streptomyces sp. NPDC088258 TaxID=3365849 RepID=UPI0037F665C9
MSRFYARRMPRAAVLLVSALLAVVAALVTAPAAQAAMPTPVAAATARTYLATLTVQAEGSSSGYSRDLFPHWITQSGTCNTREVVLKRDGTNVTQDAACAAVSGNWYSEYDGATTTSSSGFDIDHMVPLAEAWRSGASGWTTAQRQAFANDLTRPQLIAVSASSNRSKGDSDPAKWLPSRTAYTCTYVRAWVQVKYYYKLTVDSAEKTALTSALSGC